MGAGPIESGDRNRQLGQDLLFGTDPKMWSTAAEKLRRGPHRIMPRPARMGARLPPRWPPRDRVFARLPYYSVLAAYRGNRQPAEVETIGRASAFRGAHHLAELTGMDVPPVDKLPELDKIRSDADEHFRAVTDAFDGDVARLTTEPPSNWHALDNAALGPVHPGARRRRTARLPAPRPIELEANRQQPDGSQVAPPRMRDRCALGPAGARAPRRNLAGPPAGLRRGGPGRASDSRRPDRRAASGLAKDARGQSDRSVRAPSLREERGPGRYVKRGRLADPAAPLLNPDPVAALQRQRRHSFLLWQAQRTTTEVGQRRFHQQLDHGR